MAIAEAEPKKSEVAVTSTGATDGIKHKVLNTGNNLTKRTKRYASSSTSPSVGSIKRYNLYENIKGFRFEMPDGWNDQDIALFVACCWEKKEDFSKPNVDRTKIWADIANSGAKKSENPSLFTINNCLELAERIRDYVKDHTATFLDNEPFMKFHADVKSLLPHFSNTFVTIERVKFENKKGNKNKIVLTDCEHKLESQKSDKVDLLKSGQLELSIPSKSVPIKSGIFKCCKTPNDHKLHHCCKPRLLNNPPENSDLNPCDSDVELLLRDVMLEFIPEIKSENPNVWDDVTNKMRDLLGMALHVKPMLEIEKSKIIFICGGKRKRVFLKHAKGLVEVFDHIKPKTVRASDYIPSADSTINVEGKEKQAEDMRNVNSDQLTDSEPTKDKFVDSSEILVVKDYVNCKKNTSKLQKNKILDNASVIKIKENLLKQAVADQDVSYEPTSTISFEELSQKKVIQVESDSPVNNTNEESPGEENLSCKGPLPDKKPTKHYTKRLRSQGVTARALPLREARCKIKSYSLARYYKPRRLHKEDDTPLDRYRIDALAPEITNLEEEDIKRLKVDLSKPKIANPDTTTNDLDDKLTCSSPSNDVQHIKRLNRKRKESLERKQVTLTKQDTLSTKVRVVHADSTMKNPVVKLVDCQYRMDRGLNFSSHGNVFGLPKPKEKMPVFNNSIQTGRNKEDSLIEETVVLAKDVVDSEYNPNTDSAKLVSEEHLNKNHHSTASSGEINWANDPSKASNFNRKEHSQLLNSTTNFTSMPAVTGDSLPLTKVHVNPFCEPSKINNTRDNSTTLCLQDVSKPSTSSVLLPASVPVKEALDKALSSLKRMRDQHEENKLMSENNSICVTTTSSSELDMDFDQFPTWINAFMLSQRELETWKMEQLIKMQKELVEIENKKVLVIEKLITAHLNRK